MTEQTGEFESQAGRFSPWRRAAFKSGLAALFALAIARQSTAAKPPRTSDALRKGQDDRLDRIAIADVIMLERWSRETHNPDVAASCFLSNAQIEVSWFKGSASEFVESGKKKPPPDTVNFDSLSPPVIWVRGGRAIAEASCAVHTVLKLNGVDAINISYTRLLWRAQKADGKWLIAGMRGVYIRDTLASCGPTRELKIDEQRLAGFRPSYRYLSYVLAAGGRPVSDDLPGVDRPETVEALRRAERQWLEQI